LAAEKNKLIMSVVEATGDLIFIYIDGQGNFVVKKTKDISKYISQRC
jgi:hypothetical protein